jgi:hypothetical protein
MSEKTVAVEISNMQLWERVCKTDPRYTKQVKDRGREYTDIDPAWLIMQATKEWGPYGSNWGLRDIKREIFPAVGDPLAEKLTNRYCMMSAVFYYPQGSFEIGNDMPIFSAKQGIYDGDWVKKLETNTLSKALSKLGFSIDVFLGKFDDSRYVQSLREEFEAADIPSQDAGMRSHLDDLLAKGATTAEKLMGAYKVASLDDMPNDALAQAIKILTKRMEANAYAASREAPPDA